MLANTESLQYKEVAYYSKVLQVNLYLSISLVISVLHLIYHPIMPFSEECEYTYMWE